MPDLRSRLAAALADRYAIERELGSGGTAVVYRARDRKHDRLVALKVLRPELAASLGSDRFLREIRIAAGLTHPHILAVHDSGDAGGLLYYVMPYVEGESLRARLQREGPLAVEEALRFAREIADALAYAHAHGVVHRDIKPGNILLVGGHAVVADFGIATAVGTETDTLTGTGFVIGTPTYMSPEQAGGTGVVDGRSDIYSLACVLQEMLTGKPPFTGTSPQAVLARHTSDPPRPIRATRASVPARVDAAVARALAKVPGDRYRTALEFGAALAEAAGPVGRAAPARRRSRSVLTLALLAAVAVGAAAWFTRGRTPARADAAAGAGVLVLPFESDTSGAIPPGSGPNRPEKLFAQAIEWLPGVRAIDGSRVTTRGGSPGEPLAWLAEARRVGARYVLAGTVLSAAEGPRVSIELYSAADGRRIVKSDEAGGVAGVPGAVDRLAIQVIGAVAEREPLLGQNRAWLLAATRSAEALGHLLQGQAKFYRFDFEGAAAAFAQAIAADSDCGLAYHRLSIAEEWRHDFPAAMTAVRAGLARQDRIGARAVGLLVAQRYYLMGQGDSAIAAFQEAVLDAPNAADAWLGLGESLYHFGGYAGHRPLDAAGAFERLRLLDSAFAPIDDHLVDLAIISGQRDLAYQQLARVPPTNPWRPSRELALALRFERDPGRHGALERVRTSSRQVISELVQLFMHGLLNPALADTLGGFLGGPSATPADRVRGAQYRLAALAALDRWPEALAAWRAGAADQEFDAWLVQAYFAGFPAESLARPMLARARERVLTGRSPDFRRPAWDELQEPFYALVHEAALRGDSAAAVALISAIDRAPRDSLGPYPVNRSLRAALEARLALLARDTALAIRRLEGAASRVYGSADQYFPMTSMAPERLRLAELLVARGDSANAARWLGSFSETWAVADGMFARRVRQLRARPTQ